MSDVTTRGLQPAGAHLGFRRIDHVSIVVEGRRTTAEVTGVAHRYPRTIRVPLHTAQRLITEGVPRRLENRLTHVAQARG